MAEALKHAVLIVGALIVILPFYAMVSYSLKSPHEIDTNTGGFFGDQKPMVDEWCVKVYNTSICRLRLYSRSMRIVSRDI